MSATFLYDVATDLLTFASDALSPARTGNPAPGVQYVSWEKPVPDSCCEGSGQLTVHLDGDGNQTGGPIVIESLDQAQISIPEVTFAITLYRCVPVVDEGGPPASQELDTSAKQLLSDLWSLVKALQNGIRDNNLYIGADCCGGTGISRIELLPPQGGCGGVVAYVTIVASDPGPT